MTESSLKVLVVGLSWPPETFIERLLRGLAAKGVEVTVTLESRPSDWPEHPNLVWRRLPATRWPRAIRLMKLIVVAAGAFARSPAGATRLWRTGLRRPRRARLRSWYRTLPHAGRRWDVMYFPWNSAAIDHLPLFELEGHKVISCRGSQIQIAPHRSRRATYVEDLRTTFERASAVHCVSKALLEEARCYGLQPAKARVIYAGVDTELFSPEKRRREGREVFRIVSTGSLIWRKGHEYSLVAVRRLVDAGIESRYEIIGDGPDRDRILFTIRDLELEAHVRLLGRLRPEAVRDRLQASDAFLFASLSEGVPNALLEAMACGLPVVTAECGGISEAVEDGVNGLTVPVRDPAALARALIEVANNPELAGRLGRAARATVCQQFALERHIEEFASLFRSVHSNDDRLRSGSAH
ncbi:MAG: glycosyltransferase family 4 protein [bacterium]|nr:glycosyltransferase family 4 protein [bacterium]